MSEKIKYMSEKINCELPEKPMSIFQQTTTHALVGGVVGALIETGYQAIANAWNKQPQKFDGAAIREFAVELTVISALIGFFTGREEQKTYALNVENVKLQNQINQLEEDNTVFKKSFVDQLNNSQSPELQQALIR